MKNILVANINTLTGQTDFTLSDKDFETLNAMIENYGYKADTMHGAVYATAIGVFDKTDLVVKRNNRDIDLPVIGKAMAFMYDHHLDLASDNDLMWYLKDALDGYVEVDLIDIPFVKAVVKLEETKYLLEQIGKLPN